jgi:hypothetical protein
MSRPIPRLVKEDQARLLLQIPMLLVLLLLLLAFLEHAH